MKTKVFVFVLVALAFSQVLIAQENGFSMSIGVPFNFTSEHMSKDEDFAGYSSLETVEWGINLNLMFFKDSSFGYYINIYGIISQR